VDVYSPDDQVARLKQWWSQYGTSLITGVVIGIGMLAGLKYWQYHRTAQSEAASAVYQKMLSQFSAGMAGQAETLGQSLIQDYDGTPYAGKAALMIAKLKIESGNAQAAREQLEWASKKAKEPAVQHVARLRLGRLLLEEKKPDEALRAIDIRSRGGFDSSYEELRGDALLAKDDRAGAHQAYKNALDQLPKGSRFGKYLQMKHDSTASIGDP